MANTIALADEIDVLERREHALRLRHQGGTYRDIARELGVSVDIIQEDFRALRNDWLRRIARNRAVWMSEILSDIMSLRAMAIEGYMRSVKPSKENMQEDSEKGSRSRRTRKTKNFDPRFLSIALDCDKQRAAILGLGDKAAVDRVDEMLGKKRPKLLVVRDREQASQLVDVSKMLELEFSEPLAAPEDTVEGGVLGADGGQAVSDAAPGDDPQGPF
jgi:hypothetical protein